MFTSSLHTGAWLLNIQQRRVEYSITDCFEVRVRCRRKRSSRSLSHLLMSFLFLLSCSLVGLYIRQGGVLSPYLFSLYVDDVVGRIRECRARCYVKALEYQRSAVRRRHFAVGALSYNSLQPIRLQR